jgi:hypothetical protein
MPSTMVNKLGVAKHTTSGKTINSHDFWWLNPNVCSSYKNTHMMERNKIPIKMFQKQTGGKMVMCNYRCWWRGVVSKAAWFQTGQWSWWRRLGRQLENLLTGVVVRGGFPG